MRVEALRPPGDNYIWILDLGGNAVVVDPGVADPVRAWLAASHIPLAGILVTHGHGDHTGGVAALKAASRCEVVAAADGVAGADRIVAGGESLCIGGREIRALATPGHTRGHVAFLVPDAGAVFTGDALFACGCGRVGPGMAPVMWQSLMRLRALPDETRVYGGHDYTLDNLVFAADLEPGNDAVAGRLAEARTCDGRTGLPPAAMAEEKRTNPFLRCDDPAFQRAVGMAGAPAADVFAEVRRRKDRWG